MLLQLAVWQALMNHIINIGLSMAGRMFEFKPLACSSL